MLPHDYLDELASASRSAQAAQRQATRRQAEQNARRQAVEFSRSWGRSTSWSARRLGLRPRTLAHWRSSTLDPLTNPLRGRPSKQSSYEQRHGVLEVIESIGPHVGMPTLKGLFRDMPRCEVADLQQDYRHRYRQDNRLVIHELTWHLPGQVWAMDHAEPPVPMQQPEQALLAVRDLASGMQLAWLPVADQTADTLLPLLKWLFQEHGPPLLIKSDNGSAFLEQRVASLLAQYQVVHLLSPPALPSYNGSCEAGIGSMKIRTAYHAAHQGHAQLWTPDDLEAARRQANEVHRSTFAAPTAVERWAERKPVTELQRQTFRDTIDRHRGELIAALLRKNPCTSDLEHDTIERIAIRRALVELGILTLNRRSITLPIKPNNLAKI
jgi:transposase InsO family protein